MLSVRDLVKLSHILSYALRHNPLKYNLVLDKEGWTSISELLIAYLYIMTIIIIAIDGYAIFKNRIYTIKDSTTNLPISITPLAVLLITLLIVVASGSLFIYDISDNRRKI